MFTHADRCTLRLRYNITTADLNDLQVELDINQDDFAKLGPKQKGEITTDAFRDRKYQGFIYEISPEANRQKATVQVKVKVLNPDEYLRPDMNATVAFLGDAKPGPTVSQGPAIYVPAGAVRDGAVYVLLNGRAVKRKVKTGRPQGTDVKIEEGLFGGEDLLVSPPAALKDGDRIKPKQG